jgi:general stress protein YciG
MSRKSPTEERTAAIRARREQHGPIGSSIATGLANPIAPLDGSPATVAPTRSGRRGFAAMDQGRQRQIASLGGRTAHERGQAHEFTSEEARQAGRKGGETVSQNRDHMAAIGRRGGAARSLSMQLRQDSEPATAHTASA